MTERRKLYDIVELGHERPIAVAYGFFTSENKLMTVKTYLKHWYKIVILNKDLK